MTPTATTVLDIFGIIGLVVGGYFTIFGARAKQANRSSEELIAALTKLRETDREDFNNRITTLEKQRQENKEAIARLEGQVMSYKDIPLQSIAESMAKMAQVNDSIANSNAQILETLKSSAIIAATDRSSIVNPTQEIKEQTVVHQTVQSVD